MAPPPRKLGLTLQFLDGYNRTQHLSSSLSLCDHALHIPQEAVQTMVTQPGETGVPGTCLIPQGPGQIGGQWQAGPWPLPKAVSI